MPNIGSLAVQITGSTAGLSASLKQSETLIERFNKSVNKKGAAGKGVRESLGVDGAQKSNFGLGLLGSGLKKAVAPLAIIGGTLGAIASAEGLAGIVQQSISLAAEMEDSQTTFKVMLGDMGKAKRLMADITDLAAKTPLNTRELTEAGGMLLSADVKDTQIVPTLTMLGDVASGVNQPLKDIVYLYNQVRTQGRLYGDDLRQFTGRGIPLIAAFAQSMGVSETAVKGLVEEGKIGFPELQGAMKGMTSAGGRFFGMMDERSHTFNGMLSTMVDNWQQLAAKFGQAIIEEFNLKPLMERLSLVADVTKGKMDDFRPTIRALADLAGIAGAAILDMAVGGVVGVALLIDDIRTLTADMKELGRWGKAAVDGFLGPLAALRHLGDKPVKAPAVGDQMAEQIKKLTDAVKQARDLVKGDPGTLAAANWEANSHKAFSLADVANQVRTIPDQNNIHAGYDAAGFVTGSMGVTARAGGDLIMDKSKALANVFGGLGLVAAKLTKTVSVTGIQIEANKVTADQAKHVKSLAEEMDPFIKIRRELGELNTIRERGGFAQGGVLNRLADRQGIGQNKLFDFAKGKIFEPLMHDIAEGNKLAASAMKGSVEAQSVINQSRSDESVSVESKILAAVEAANELQREQILLSQKIEAALAKNGLLVEKK